MKILCRDSCLKWIHVYTRLWPVRLFVLPYLLLQLEVLVRCPMPREMAQCFALTFYDLKKR